MGLACARQRSLAGRAHNAVGRRGRNEQHGRGGRRLTLLINSVYVGRGSGRRGFFLGSPLYGRPESLIASYSAHEKSKSLLDALAAIARTPTAVSSLVIPLGPYP